MELSDDDTEENEDSVGTKEEEVEEEAEDEERCKGTSVQVGVSAVIGALWVNY